MSIMRILRFWLGDPTIENNISPYIYSLFIICPALAFSYYVNSGIPKDDMTRVKMFIATVVMLGIILGGMSCTWLANASWWIIERFENYKQVLKLYPELFAPAKHYV